MLSKATEVTTRARFYTKEYPVQGITMSKSLGQLATASVAIQLDGAANQSISGDEVNEFARDFNDKIINKTDPDTDAIVSIQAGTEFVGLAGVVTSCGASVAAKGSTLFTIGVTEPPYLIGAMALNVYPPDLASLSPVVQTAQKYEAKHPFARSIKATGSIGERILGLYTIAKIHFRKSEGDSPADKAMEAQRATNLRLEQVFIDMINRSETALPWIEDAPPSVQVMLNDFIANKLFGPTSSNLWSALLEIANATGMVYAGDFGVGGRFIRLDITGDAGPDYTAGAVSSRQYALSGTTVHSIGQVIALPPDPNPAGGFFSLVTPHSANSKKAAGKYPEEPAPAGGKVLVVRAPSFFLPKKRAVEDGDQKEMDGTTKGDMEDLADIWKGAHDETIEDVDPVSKAIDKWCAEIYRQYRTKNVRATIVKPLEVGPAWVGDNATAGDLNGLLSSVVHSVAISGDNGSATSTFSLAYIQPS